MLSLTACEVEETKDNKDGPPGTDGEIQDVTDYSRCSSPGPAPHSIEGTWSSAGRAEGGINYKFVWTINNRRLYLANTCYFRGRQLTARTQVSADYNDNYFEVLNSNSNTTEINEEDFQMSCYVSIEPMAANYTFNGRCLVLTINGYDKPLTLVPEQ
ncbi:hypothetical protein D3C72_1266540 [compost metagenome]